MRRSVEAQGDTVEEAVDNALSELGVGRESVNVEVLEEEGKSGFLGLKRARHVRVRVTMADGSAEGQPGGRVEESEEAGSDVGDDGERLERLKETAERVLEALDLRGTITVSKVGDETLHVEMIGDDDLGVLIGRHGQTLEALQTVLGLIANKGEAERRRVTLDVEEYRRRRAEELESLAERVAQKAIDRGEPVVLRPMTPFERKVVHVTLHDNPDVETYSEGEEPYRRIVVEPK